MGNCQACWDHIFSNDDNSSEKQDRILNNNLSEKLVYDDKALEIGNQSFSISASHENPIFLHLSSEEVLARYFISYVI